jgi:dihydroorotate dehydrogenase (fumarate)
MDLTTRYLGLTLPHPIVPGASPLVDDLDAVKRLAEAGAPAIVMHSLFQEQVGHGASRTLYELESRVDGFSAARAEQPRPYHMSLGPDEYLAQLARVKAATGLPVIASLNGTTANGWLEYAALLEQGGASAIELNVYQLATDLEESGASVEHRLLRILHAVKQRVTIPVAVKLAPHYSAFANLARELDALGADGLVMFNRFYQPDIDVERLEVAPRLELSTPAELRLRLRWTAILAGRVRASLIVSGGVHGPEDVVKAVMAGADGVQMVSALLQRGPEYLRVVLDGLRGWLAEHDYDSLGALRGSLSLFRCPDPSAFERANYLRVLQTWKRPERSDR